tara:strand:+ start:451 stop:723 length:273 start_codon:yes stop_codon:yes gene_type:complete
LKTTTSPLLGYFKKILLGIIGNENGKECLEYPYEYLETKIKSPTSRLGFIDPDGMLNGSKIKDLINRAIKMAIKIDLILLKILFLAFIKK